MRPSSTKEFLTIPFLFFMNKIIQNFLLHANESLENIDMPAAVVIRSMEQTNLTSTNYD